MRKWLLAWESGKLKAKAENLKFYKIQNIPKIQGFAMEKPQSKLNSLTSDFNRSLFVCLMRQGVGGIVVLLLKVKRVYARDHQQFGNSFQ